MLHARLLGRVGGSARLAHFSLHSLREWRRHQEEGIRALGRMQNCGGFIEVTFVDVGSKRVEARNGG